MNEMLKTLTRRSFAASRVRNLITILAIALTAVLFTSVTTLGMGAIQSITLTMQMQKGSTSDGDFRNMTAEQFKKLKQADFIKQAGLRMPVGFLSNTNRHNVELDIVDEIQAGLTFCLPTHGKMPQAPNEIVASDRALRDLGLEPEVGAQVTVEFTAHGQQYSLPMVVSGWYEALNDQISIMAAGAAFQQEHPDIFRYTYDTDRDIAGTYFSDFTAATIVGLQEKMNAFSRQAGGDPEDLNAPNFLPGTINKMTHPTVDPKTAGMAVVLIALFIFCGYLLIYNVFDIAVMQEIHRYGLYRTIGMSKYQIKKLINQQALWLSCVGIPIGLVIGFFIGRTALPLVMDVLSTSYKNIAAEVSPSPVIFLGAAVLTAFTVFLSTRKPVKLAATISPLEAFHYVENGTKRTTRKSAPGANIPCLAWSNLGRNKRRSAFIMVSLMLCIVLLNCAGTAANSVDIEKQVAYMIRTDFSVVNTASTNGQKGFTRRDHALRQQTMDDIQAQPGVIGASPVYKNTVEDTNITYGFDVDWNGQTFVNKNNGLTFGATTGAMNLGLGDDGHPICNVYGLEEVALARMDIREGETNVHTLYQKMAAGEGLVVGVPIDRTNMTLNKNFDFVDIGETVTVYKDGQPALELPVLAKAGINGDDQEIGYTCNGPMETGGDSPFFYLPTEIYKTIYDKPAVYKYSFNVEKAQQENMAAFLQEYMKNIDTSMDYLSAESSRKNAEGARTMINFVGSLIGFIFGFAGVLNLTNMIITTVLTRRHEFATMQSIGMTFRQLTNMMMLEGIYYALGACLMGFFVSAILNLTLIKSIVSTIWYFTFQFTLLPALITSMLLLVLAAIIPIAALKTFNRGSIVEQLRMSD